MPTATTSHKNSCQSGMCMQSLSFSMETHRCMGYCCRYVYQRTCNTQPVSGDGIHSYISTDLSTFCSHVDSYSQPTRGQQQQKQWRTTTGSTRTTTGLTRIIGVTGLTGSTRTTGLTGSTRTTGFTGSIRTTGLTRTIGVTAATRPTRPTGTMDQATTGRVMGAAVAQLPHTYDSRCALQHADASATRTRITTAATRTLTRASVGCTTHPYALGNSTNLRVTRPSPLFPSTVLSSLSTLVLFIMAASFGLPPVLASTTLITVHINSPSCWYKPAFMPNRGSLSDVDLLANSYDMVVPVRESNELTGQTEPGNGGFPGPISGFPPPPASTAAATNSTGQTPGSLSSGAGRRAAFLRSPAWCVLSSTTYGYYQFDTTKTSLLRYENCTDNACVNGCTLAASAAYPPPTTDDFYTNDTCNGLVYKITNPSDIPTPLPSVDAYSRYMVSSVYPFSSTSRPCSGIPRTSNLVKIYDNCTLISVPGAPLAYAISQVLDEQVSQKLCRDRTCSTCATSNSFAPWSRSNECIPRGLTRVRGLIFPQDASNSTQPVMVNPSVSDSPPSLPNAFTTPVIVAIAAAGTALLIMIGLLIWCIASRVGRKRHDNEKIPYQQQQQPSVVLPPRIATIVASSGQPQGTSVYGANHHTSNQQNAFSASKIVQILEQPHTVVVDYEPQMTDELRLVIGDQVILESVWSDGWAQAYNITSGERGTLAIATLDSASQTAPSTTTTTAY